MSYHAKAFWISLVIYIAAFIAAKTFDTSSGVGGILGIYVLFLIIYRNLKDGLTWDGQNKEDSP